MKTFPGRITVEADTCGGRPYFKGTRIPVYIVLEMVGNQEDQKKIFENFPDLTPQDLKDSVAYARNIAELPAAALPASAA